MIARAHETYEHFLWRRVRYDPDNHRFVTYECDLCHTSIEEPPDRLNEALAAHQERCEGGAKKT